LKTQKTPQSFAKTISFKPKKIAVAVAATLLTTVAVASVIQYAVNEDNMTRDGDVTYVFADATKTAPHNGYLVVDDKEGIVAPGVGVYTVDFSSGGSDYQGCIMSSKGEPPVADGVTTCAGDPDSGKRFKLRATRLGEPMDIVFNITNTGDTKLYNVYGKLTNDASVDATGFTAQIGTGIGANFRELPGVTFVGGTTQLGKYPGGLFGGSPAEGLPFFNVNSARFTGTATSTHTLATNGMPTQYSTPFGDWLPLSGVPQAWFYDADGRPWTDDKLVAWEKTPGVWATMAKSWPAVPEVTINGTLVNLGKYAEFSKTFIDAGVLTDEINVDLTPTPLFKVQDVVNAMLTILTITEEPVVPGNEGWTTNPPTVTDGVDGALVATWDYENEEYDVELAYQATLGGASVPMETMQTEVNKGTYTTVAGYSQGIIEDLANVNVYYAIQMGAGVTGPLTMRVTVTDDTSVVPAPLPPATTPTTSSGGGGCAIGGNGRFDPTLPALLAAGLGFFGWRRFKAGT
jgi:hypothetical protein